MLMRRYVIFAPAFNRSTPRSRADRSLQLFAAVLATSDVKVNYGAVAAMMGSGKPIRHLTPQVTLKYSR